MRNCFFVWVGGDGTCFCVCKSLFCFNLPPAFQWVFSKSTAASGTEWPERFQLRLPPVRGGLVRQRQFLKAWLQTARFFFCRINLCATSIAKRRLFRLVGEVGQPSPHKLATLEMGGNGPSRPGWEFRGFL